MGWKVQGVSQGKATSRRARRVRRRYTFESLEQRIVFAVNASPFAPPTWTTLANGIPVLTSNPTAPAFIYLDYDGDAGQNSSETDFDDTPGEFTSYEQERIAEHWRGISAVFSMFNVGVTTVQPAAGVPTAWVSITNDMINRGGVNAVGSFPDTGASGVSGSDWWAQGYAHELSHGLGNWHTSTYDSLGNKTAEYGVDPSSDFLHGNIMGGYGGNVQKWVMGFSSVASSASTLIQSDMAIISSALSNIDGAGDGYRPDDQTSTTKTNATALTAVDSTTQAAVGIIERNTDQDWYSFTSTGGSYNVMVGRDYPSQVDVRISVYAADGTTLVATDDGDPIAAVTEGSATYRTMVNDSHVTLTLPAGTYYLKVEGHGNYDDQGQYLVRVDQMLSGWQAEDIGIGGAPGFSDYNPVTGEFTVGGSGRGLGGTVSQGGDAAHMAYQKLVGNGEIVAQISSIDSNSSLIRGGLVMRESLATGSTFVAAMTRPDGGVFQQRRTSTDANSSTAGTVTFPAGAKWLKLKREGDTFTSYWSSDGVNWTELSGARTVAMSAEIFVGLVTTAGNNYDYLNSNWVSSATFTNVQVAGQLNLTHTNGLDPAQPQSSLAAPINVTVSGFTSTTANVTWEYQPAALPGDYNQDGMVDASDYVLWRRNDGSQVGLNTWQANLGKVRPTVTGFQVERSLDGINFDTVAIMGSNVFTFGDTNLAGAQRYYYRVRTMEPTGLSAASTIASGVTRASAATNLSIMSYSNSSLAIQWKDGSGESSYKLQRSTNGTSWTTIGNQSTSTTRNTSVYVDTGRSSNTKYYYRLISVDAQGDGPISEVVSGYTRINSTPTVSFSSRTASAMSLSWTTTATGITRWAVYRGRASGTNEWDLLDDNITTTSFSDTNVQPVTEYHYRVVGYNANGAATLAANIFGASGPLHAVSVPWTSQDIGAVSGPGSADLTNGTFTIIGSGADIWGTSDEFQYVYLPMNGNGYIQARVTGMEDPPTEFYSRVGLMIRESTAVNSNHVSLMLHQTGGGVRLQYRDHAIDNNTREIIGATVAPPQWLRITRSGNTFTGQISTNGVSWTTVGSINVTMGTNVLIGMAVTDRNDSFMHWGTFDQVSSSVLGADGAGSGALLSSSDEGGEQAPLPPAEEYHNICLNDGDAEVGDEDCQCMACMCMGTSMNPKYGTWYTPAQVLGFNYMAGAADSTDEPAAIPVASSAVPAVGSSLSLGLLNATSSKPASRDRAFASVDFRHDWKQFTNLLDSVVHEKLQEIRDNPELRSFIQEVKHDWQTASNELENRFHNFSSKLHDDLEKLATAIREHTPRV